MIQDLFSKYSEHLKIRRVRSSAGVRDEIFDPIRAKYLVVQPEEIVRQLVVQYLLDNRGVPTGWIRTEMGITVNERQKRCDIVVFDKAIQPRLIVECKRPSVDITQATFFQIATYNSVLKVPFLVVTNGKQTFCAKILFDKLPADPDDTGGEAFFEYLSEIPSYENLIL